MIFVCRKLTVVFLFIDQAICCVKGEGVLLELDGEVVASLRGAIIGSEGVLAVRMQRVLVARDIDSLGIELEV